MVQHSSTKSGFQAGNPIANALVVVAGVLAIGASIVLGVVAFVALSAIILVTAAIIGIRVWWFKRKIGPDSRMRAGSAGQESANSVIEGEYQVVHKDRDEA
ncbi:MAG: hypothetical protein OEU90_13550 [Gammaproteobacteria bacterium]|nr:hypothetical protein [Gammaproteobacteria bacterium]MDH3749705.1 hypothetical protein [Gammaproteobacteria bacterium]MDH3806480.1 hypothetical protein [Gammaproteobacteria bacterium]